MLRLFHFVTVIILIIVYCPERKFFLILSYNVIMNIFHSTSFLSLNIYFYTYTHRKSYTLLLVFLSYLLTKLILRSSSFKIKNNCCIHYKFITMFTFKLLFFCVLEVWLVICLMMIHKKRFKSTQMSDQTQLQCSSLTKDFKCEN